MKDEAAPVILLVLADLWPCTNEMPEGHLGLLTSCFPVFLLGHVISCHYVWCHIQQKSVHQTNARSMTSHISSYYHLSLPHSLYLLVFVRWMKEMWTLGTMLCVDYSFLSAPIWCQAIHVFDCANLSSTKQFQFFL